MTFDNTGLQHFRNHLKDFEFQKLFIEHLGWDRHGGEISIDVGDTNCVLQGIAQKRGVQILEYKAPAGKPIPDYNIRKKMEKLVTKAAYEHLIIFTDSSRTTQIWQWVARSPGKPDACREVSYRPASQSGDLILQKLHGIRFTLDEEESIDIAGASHRLRDAFDRDTVTKKFFDRFKDEQEAFLEFIEGISDLVSRKWYASLMLNRLMFIWFIQEKGFLDGDNSYLRNRLKSVSELKGKDKFHTFYRYFLLALFHDGFGKRPEDRKLDKALTALLGKIPYLNGGLFDPHRIETENKDIHIPDEAFTKLFAFFDEWDWHLDTSIISEGREINPDVLGYIFEKYINQKQMGAYYTKEDITEYIGKNTIIPLIFDSARKKCAVAFEPDSALWHLLQEDPDSYIYPAVKKGVIDEEGKTIPLPADIEKGLDTSKSDLLERRKGWNAHASSEYALPTEIWREHVARRQRCLEVREKLSKGEIHEINDLITYNLNIRQFAERVVSECEGPDLLRAFWQSIRDVTVLDPTCGSGAFLFAALEILFPLYEACLTRMQGFVEDLDRSEGKHSPKKFSDFRDVLNDIARHPSRDYFILKSIIVNNLYGVDIMPEAVEICKLRLFLKLVSQIENVDQLEPLPDIDFNIRSGNTLVGFATESEVRNQMTEFQDGQMKLLDSDDLQSYQRFHEKVEIVARAFEQFRKQQTKLGGSIKSEDKQELRKKLEELEEELNQYLARQYGVNPEKPTAFKKWKASHQPFHWFVEFYKIMHDGGFDVIIGNPPYVEVAKIKGQYDVHGYSTLPCGNLYAFVGERCVSLSFPNGRIGLIVPIGSASLTETATWREYIMSIAKSVHSAHYAIRPAKLFNGVEQRLSIYLLNNGGKNSPIFSSKYHQWYVEERPILFDELAFEVSPLPHEGSIILKSGNALAASILSKINKHREKILAFNLAPSSHLLFFHRTPGYWVRIMDFLPYFRSPSGDRSIHHIRELQCLTNVKAGVVGAVVSSSSYFFWLFASGNCRNLTLDDVHLYPVGELELSHAETLSKLFKELMKDFKKNSFTSRRGDSEFQEFDWGLSKPIIDEIDKVLASHYGFSEEELDFIINYDIKYRMGDSLESEEE